MKAVIFEIGSALIQVGLAQVPQRIGIPADRCLYVDDSQHNVRGAQAAGIPSILYSSIGPLRRELRERGFLPPSPWARYT